MRLPRFFGKKLGHRRTGSQAWGSFGEALFYAALVAAGACFVGLLFSGMGGVESDAAGMPWARWWLWLFALLMPGALLAFGASGLVRTVRSWGKSEERRAATGAMTDFLDPIARGQGLLATRAGVPAWEDLVNSPGTVLRYRLPIENPESWTLLGIGLFVILWNAVLVILAVNASLDLLHGRVESVLLAVLIPFGVVGVTAILLFARRLVLATAVGTTQLEISDHPLVPGGRYDVLIAQGGVGLFTTLTVTLEAEEMASFRQGTDTRTERIVVVRDAVGEWTEVRINPGVRFEAHLPIVIPNDAMHSFASEHNAVRWRLVVQGQPQRWAAFVRSFPIVVFPQAAAAMADEHPGPAVLEGSG